MMVTVEADDAKGPGYATIRVPGAGEVADCGFRISRDATWPEPNLGPSGWQGAEALLKPDAVERDGRDLLLQVGPMVCEWLDEGVFSFELPMAGLASQVRWPDIEAVHGGSGARFAVPQRPAPASELATPRPSPSPPVAAEPEPLPAAAEPRRADAGPLAVNRPGRPLLPVLMAALAVLAASGGGWWWLHRPVAEPPRAEPAPSPAPAPAVADLDGMSVRDLIARGNTTELVDQARKRLANRPQDALLLLESAGEDRHDGAALTLLAQLYDPNKPRQGGIGADPRQAAKNYREAERRNDHSGAADREALRRTLAAARDRGDMQAKLTEGDFWP